MESVLAAHFPELYVASGAEAEAAHDPAQLQQNNVLPTSGTAPAHAQQAADDAPPGSQQDPYQEKIEHITGRFQSKRTGADELEAYLHEAEARAKEAEARALAQADAEFTAAWRHTGLPLRPSHLSLDHDKLASGGLVNPKAIMGQYQALRSQEVLNPPRTYEYNDTSIAPNYLATTANLQSRKSTVLPPDKMTRVTKAYLAERSWPHLSQEEVAARIAESEERRRVQDLRMPPSQYDLEKKIIAGMHHKLSFLRNPRYPLPPAVKALKEQYTPAPTWGVGGAGGGWDGGEGGGAKAVTKPPIKSDMTSRPEAVFVAEPEEVVFTDYEVGAVYTRAVRIRNVTAVTRGLRLLPPASQYFHASMPRFPTDSGAVAPGMAAEVYIKFTPDSLADYDDGFVVDTAASRFTVSLKARRPPPMLTLPNELHVGEVVCGNRQVRQFRFHNLGGQGRFRVIPVGLWPTQYASAPHDLATIGPFQVWPLFFDLAPGTEAVLSVGYEPQDMGVHEESLVVVCDNCQVKSFTLRGLASDVDVQLESVDGLNANAPTSPAKRVSGAGMGPAALVTRGSLDLATQVEAPPAAAMLDMPLWFGAVVPGSGFTRRLAVRNTTTLPFPFQWSMTNLPQTRAERPLNVPLGVDAEELLELQYQGQGVLSHGSATGGARGVMDFAAGGGGVRAGMAPAGAGHMWGLGLGGGTEAVQDGSTAAVQGDDGRGTLSTPLTDAALAAASQPSQLSQPKGQVDLVALGMEPDVGFEVTPAEGVLQPGEVAEFSITFLPQAVKRYARWAQLKVDKGLPGHGDPCCDVGVLEVGMEGVGGLLELELAPRHIVVPGGMYPGALHSRTVTLTNPTRAPAQFDFAGTDDLVSVEPAAGTVPPMGSTQLTVTLRADERVGHIERLLQCNVMHGPSLPLTVAGKVEAPRVELATPRVDFGLVRLAGTAVRTLRLRNTSGTCNCSWSIEEVEDIQQPAQGQAAASKSAAVSVNGSSPTTPSPASRQLLKGGSMGSSLRRSRVVTIADAGETAEQAALISHASRTDRRLSQSRAHVSGSLGGGSQAAVAAVADGVAESVGLPAAITHLTFWPPCGTLGPGEEVEVEVTCHALSGGAHRSVVRVVSGAQTSIACCEAFAAVVTPTVAVSRPKVDLGATFVGVMCRFSLSLRNLSLLPVDFKWSPEAPPGDDMPGLGPDGSPGPRAEVKIRPDVGTLEPGEEVEIQVRFTPRVPGPITFYGVCDLEGSPLPAAFSISCTARDLDVHYELLTPEQYTAWAAAQANPRLRKRRDDVDNFRDMTHLPPEVLAKLGPSSKLAHKAVAGEQGGPPRQRHHVANFGEAVPLGDTRHMYLVITNLSAIPSSLRTWLECFGVEDVGKLSGSLTQAAAAANGTRRGPAMISGPPPPQLLQPQVGSSGAVSASPPVSLTKGPKPHRYAPIRLDGECEKTAPFRATAGNAMMATRRLQADAEKVLGSKGLAISVTPPSCGLPAWGRAVLQVSMFNDMCGDYFDMLHVKVGSLPSKDIPIRAGVTGTPLVVQPQRVLVAGLQGRGDKWCTRLDFGALPAGVPLQRTFYVFNTGSLDMQLGWTFMRYQDESDCGRPNAQLFDVTLETLEVAGDEGTSDAESARRQSRASGVSAGTTPRVTGSGSGPAADGVNGGVNPGGVNPGGVNGGVRSRTTSTGGGTLGAESASVSGSPTRAPPSVSGEHSLGSSASQGVLGLVGWEEGGGAGGASNARVRLKLAPHAAPDTQPFVVEPAEAVVRGGESVCFTVTFVSDRPARHAGYLRGVQRVFSPEVPLALKLWPSGEWGEGCGAMLSGVFHPYAGMPPTPLQPLRVDLTASPVTSRLEPDAQAELAWVCTSTTPLNAPAFSHVITLTNLQACPLIFSLDTNGPFKLLSAVPSAPQDPVMYRGTTGLTAPPGSLTADPTAQAAAAAATRWTEGQTYLPPGDSVDVTLQFRPPRVEHREDYDLAGQLVVRYANGDVQELSLSGHILHPALEVRHAQQLTPVVLPPSSDTQQDEGEDGGLPQEATPWVDAAGGAAAGVGATAGLGSSLGRTGGSTAVLGSTLGSTARTVVFPGPGGSRLPGPSPDETWAAAHPTTLLRADGAPLSFGRVHVQGPKSLEVTLLNPTLVDALWAVTTGASAAKYCRPEDAHTMAVTQSEAAFGPFRVRPAHGLLAGRGLKLPRAQRLTITFAPPDNKTYRETLVFGVSKGRPVALELVGQGSYEEGEEHQRVLYQL